MRLPTFQPQAMRRHHDSAARAEGYQGLTPQGCNYLACAGAIAQCINNPNPLQCILQIAPNCAGCV